MPRNQNNNDPRLAELDLVSLDELALLDLSGGNLTARTVPWNELLVGKLFGGKGGPRPTLLGYYPVDKGDKDDCPADRAPWHI